MNEFITIFGVLFGGLVFATLWLLLPYFMRRREVSAIRRACRREGIIVLTFDDGPGQRLTFKIVDLLNELNIKASFFVLGNRAVEAPETLLELKRNGHEIGGHTSRHLNAWKTLPVAHCRDLLDGQNQIAGITGRTKLFRPAYGKMSLASWIVAKLQNLNLAWWTIDPKDSLEDPRSHQAVLDAITSNGGGVILLHDYDDYPNDDHDGYVLTLIKKIHGLSKELDLRFVTYSDLLAVVRPDAG